MSKGNSSKASKSVRVGVVGLGMGKHHVRFFKEAENCEMIAICDVNEPLLEVQQKEHNVPRTFTDTQKMFESGEIDAVSIATPNTLHHPLTMAALEAGLHVLCEKPMAMNAEQAQEMVDTAAKKKLKLGMHFNHRMRAQIFWLRSFAEKGDLGEVYFARTHWHRRKGIPRKQSFLTKASAGGGCLIDLGVHMLDQTLFVMGYPKVKSVTASNFRKFDKSDAPGLDMEVEDFSVALMRFDNGSTLEMEISWASNHDHPEELGMQFYGDKGGAKYLCHQYRYDESQIEVYRREHGALTTTAMGRAYMPIPSVQQDFVNAILEDREPLAAGVHGLETMKVLDAIYASAEKGSEVVVA